MAQESSHSTPLPTDLENNPNKASKELIDLALLGKFPYSPQKLLIRAGGILIGLGGVIMMMNPTFEIINELSTIDAYTIGAALLAFAFVVLMMELINHVKKSQQAQNNLERREEEGVIVTGVIDSKEPPPPPPSKIPLLLSGFILSVATLLIANNETDFISTGMQPEIMAIIAGLLAGLAFGIIFNYWQDTKKPPQIEVAWTESQWLKFHKSVHPTTDSNITQQEDGGPKPRTQSR